MAQADPDPLLRRWYAGDPEGRGIWDGPGKFLGLMETPDLAAEACEAHNKALTGSYT